MPGADHDDGCGATPYDLDPATLEPGTRVHKLPSRGSKLSGAVPIRFSAKTIEVIKRIADEQHVTVSAWIRREIEGSLQRHRTVTLHENLVQFRPQVLRDEVAAEVRRLVGAAGS